MPVIEEAEPERGAVRIQPSAAAELFWALRAIAGHEGDGLPGVAGDDPRLLRLRPRVRRLWEDEGRDFGEILILAHLTGHLLDPALDGFLGRIAEPVPFDERSLALESETEEDRARLVARLRRLSSDARARATYARVLREAWDLARPEWERAGLPAVLAACEARRERVARGATVRDLLEHKPGHGGRFLRQQEEAAARGELAIAPVHLARLSLFFDLPGLYFTGVPTEGKGYLAVLRARSAGLARRLRVVSDPTRLAILGFLTREPSTITETARAFGLAQPTVSAHFRLLREAGLVISARRDGRTTFEVDRDRLEGLVRDVSHELLEP